MAAYFDTGFSVRQPMWHGLGMVADEYPADWDEARRMAGLLWEPAKRPLFVPRTLQPGQPIPVGAERIAGPDTEVVIDGEQPQLVAGAGDPTVVHVPVEGSTAIIRDDTEAVLATPSSSFELIYHSQMGELLDAYSEAWRKAGANVKFETAGSVKGGAMVWALVWLDEPIEVPGDPSPTYPFAALLNAHDGSAACKLVRTSVRVVCWNTWKMAEVEGDRTGQQVVLRHTGNVADRLEQAKASLAGMRDEAKAWQMVAADLAAINVGDGLVRQFLDEFIPADPEGATERTRNERAARRAIFTKLYEESPTTDGIRGTAYGLVQAAGEYLDHLRPFRSRDTYLARTMLTNEPVKGGVVKLVRQLVDAG